MIDKDGYLHDVEFNLTSLIKDGKFVGSQGTVRDITERKKTEKKIQEQIEFLNIMIESLTHPFYVVDAKDYTIRLANSAASLGKLTKTSTCFSLTHRRRTPCKGEHACPLQEVKRTKKPAAVEHIHYDTDGNKRNLEVHGYPILDSKGNVVQMIEYALDITERKKAEQKLKRNQEMLKASERSLKEFSRKVLSVREEEKRKLAANLHDAVGSLAVNLSSRLAIIEHEIKDGNLQAALERLQQIKRTVKEEVRALKRIAREVRPPDLDIVGLPGVLRTHFANITKEARIKIDFSTSVDRETINDAAAIVLYRTAQEALSNVINHANANKVKVRLYSQHRTIKLNICDDGKGLDVKKALGGTKVKGIGLRGMQERAKSLNGRFTIKSTPDKGTEIMVTLPITSKQK